MKTTLKEDELPYDDNGIIEEDHSFFGLFEMNKDIWRVNSRIIDSGFIYMHSNTYRPLLILLNRQMNERDGKIELEQIIFMTTTKEFEIKNQVLQGTYTLLEGDDNKDENRNRIYYYINQFIDKFNEDGAIESETVLNYWRKFLKDTQLDLTFDFDLLNRHTKKRKC